MNTSRFLLIPALLFLPVAAGAEEWQHFQDMPENKGVYETILIEKKGIFYKEARRVRYPKGNAPLGIKATKLSQVTRGLLGRNTRCSAVTSAESF